MLAMAPWAWLGEIYPMLKNLYSGILSGSLLHDLLMVCYLTLLLLSFIGSAVTPFLKIFTGPHCTVNYYPCRICAGQNDRLHFWSTLHRRVHANAVPRVPRGIERICGLRLRDPHKRCIRRPHGCSILPTAPYPMFRSFPLLGSRCLRHSRNKCPYRSLDAHWARRDGSVSGIRCSPCNHFGSRPDRSGTISDACRSRGTIGWQLREHFSPHLRRLL